MGVVALVLVLAGTAVAGAGVGAQRRGAATLGMILIVAGILLAAHVRGS